jgi:ABC-type branched-subunit amino acid transport system substrate-binding protein
MNILKRLGRLSLLAGLLALSSMTPASADDGITPTSIKLGMSSPFSGPNGAYGEAMRDGLQACFAQVNAGGGVQGRKIELVTLDDGYETERTVANTKKLIDNEKVFALLAYYGSSPTTESMKVFSAAGVPLVGTISGADSLRNPVNHYMFHLRASYADETETIVDHLVGLGVTNIAVFYQNDGFGKSGLDGVTNALKRHKLTPSATAAVERNSVDVAAAVQTIAKANAQAVIMVTLYKPTAAFVGALRKAGQTPQFVTLSPVGTELLVKEMGPEAAHGISISQVMPYPWNDSVAIVKDYQKALAQYAKGKTPSYYGLEGYINGRLMVEALKRAGKDLSRDKLEAALEGGLFDLGGYKVNYTPSSHNGSRFVDLTIIGRNGQVLR